MPDLEDGGTVMTPIGTPVLYIVNNRQNTVDNAKTRALDWRDIGLSCSADIGMSCLAYASGLNRPTTPFTNFEE